MKNFFLFLLLIGFLFIGEMLIDHIANYESENLHAAHVSNKKNFEGDDLNVRRQIDMPKMTN